MKTEFLATNDVVAQIEADLRCAQGARQRVQTMVLLAWQLRQRNATRALSLADEVERQLESAALLPHEPALLLRLALVRAEVSWLRGEQQAAHALATHALQRFGELGDVIGCADAWWSLGWTAYGQGDLLQRDAAFRSMSQLPGLELLDPVRMCMAQLMLERMQPWLDGAAIKARFGHSKLHPAAACWVEDILAIAASQKSDYVAAIEHWSAARLLGLECGYQNLAIMSTSSIGQAFGNLNEYHTALEWLQRALDEARATGWSSYLGIVLTQTGETLRRLNRFDAAQVMLGEALSLMAPLSGVYAYARTLRNLAEGELDRQQYASALDKFRALEQHVVARNQSDLLSLAKCGQAQALLELGQAQAALQAAEAALCEAKSNTSNRISALQVLAAIHARHADLPAPPAMQAPSCALHYLEQARQLAASITDFIMPGDLLDAMAEEYDKVGHYQQAYRHARLASSAREKIHGRETENRVHAMQISYRTERAEIELAHQRELASEAKRVAILQQTSDTLEHLGAIGQEITAHLASEQVFEVLQRHAHHLLEVDFLAIYLMDANGTALNRAFSTDNGAPLPFDRVMLDDPVFDVPRCARERREFYTDQDPARPDPRWLLNTPPTLSRLFAPLLLEEQLIGVITVQSRMAQAYGAREQLIFRTLCAYTAIALSNARAHGQLAQAHRQLQETQQQMILQGKMAGLGSLTAGIAHEINNPTNFVHVAAQNQREDINEFSHYVSTMLEADDAPEIVQGFDKRFGQLMRGVITMLNGTERIKGIVKDLRTFTRLEQAEKKAVHISDCLNSTLNLVRTSWLEKVEFVTEFVDDPEIECWPALLNQVFMNLLVNGCQAIEETHVRGKLCLRLYQRGAMLVIEFEDSGIGMSQETRLRILEPFFTTKEVGKGTGLGLSIAFGIVEKHGGSLDFTSSPGHGSCFTIALPLPPALP